MDRDAKLLKCKEKQCKQRINYCVTKIVVNPHFLLNLKSLLPVVASPVGVNQEIVDHGENGFLATDADEGFKYLKILHSDRPLRHLMDKNARIKIENQYTLSHTAFILASILREASVI